MFRFREKEDNDIVDSRSGNCPRTGRLEWRGNVVATIAGGLSESGYTVDIGANVVQGGIFTSDRDSRLSADSVLGTGCIG